MPQAVEITTRTQLMKIVGELEQISKKSESMRRALQSATDQVESQVASGMEKTQKGVDNIGRTMRRVLQSLKDDFKALASVASLGAGLKISNTMGGVVRDTVKVSDTVRKLSGVFKIATRDQAAFVGQLTKGLGAIGLGGEEAANALEGLKETQVRGGGNLTGYAVAAGQLASVSGQRGQEGTIARGLADVVQARGRNVNNPAEMQTIAEAVNRTRGATGKSATDILSSMRDLLSSMNDNQRHAMTPEGLTRMAITASAGGQGATSFFQRYMRMNQWERQGIDALGGGKLFGANGLNSGALKNFVEGAKSLGGGDVNAGLQIKGLSAEEAAGLKLLYDNLSLVEKATKDAAKSTKSLAESYEDGKTLGEAFRGNFERLKSTFSESVSSVTGGLTDALKKTSHSTAGSVGVAVGSTLAAAALTRAGLGGIGSALGLKGAQEQILESRGEKVTPVRVTNAAEIGGAMSKLGGFAGKAAIASGALGVGLGAGDLLRNTETGGKLSEGIADSINQPIQALLRTIGYLPEIQRMRPELMKRQNIKIDLNVHDRNKDLKTVTRQGSGPHLGAP